ncbi:MAG: adenosylcobinamide-GDP ribazoletransferase [Chlorobiales bacterium]|nr:adenosylcobinamide-GDP ribazoletransferase [Chlorobiales bacterium]
MLNGLVTALRTLTVLPVPGKDTETFSNSLFWFPVVGLLLGLIQVAIGYAGYYAGWNELSAALVVLGGIFLTRGIHADGLADLADGFWGGKTREAILQIMKDSNVGSFGAIALSGMMLLKWIAVFKLVEKGAFGFIAGGVLLARWVQVLLASSLPYARKEGGTAHSFVNGAGWSHVLVASILSLLFLFPLLHFSPYVFFIDVVTALAAGLMIGLLSYKKIGGVTGDVLGAGSEVTEVFVWVAGAFCTLYF